MLLYGIILGVLFIVLGIASNEDFILTIGAIWSISSLYRFINYINLSKEDKTILKHGYEGAAKFIRRTETLLKSRHRYVVYYGYTDEHGEYHEVEAPGFFTCHQADTIELCKWFQIKYRGKKSVPLVDLHLMKPPD